MNKSNLFFYTRVEEEKDNEGNVIKVKKFRDAINMDHVFRIVHLNDGDKEMLVAIMDDTHEELMDIPYQTKANQKVQFKQQRKQIKTDIPIMEQEDIIRFFETFDNIK